MGKIIEKTRFKRLDNPKSYVHFFLKNEEFVIYYPFS